MKAKFDRAKLSPEAQVNYDIWELEAERAALSHANRLYRPPFYSRLYSAHSQLPDFLINTHTIADEADLKNYIARIKGMPAVLDVAIERTKASEAAGIRAPKFQVETIIAGSEKLTSGAPFGDGPRCRTLGRREGQDRGAGQCRQAAARCCGQASGRGARGGDRRAQARL
jgi:uncharacterized protein (DUF885 family)